MRSVLCWLALAAAAWGAPPDDFLEQCKQATRQERVRLTAQLKRATTKGPRQHLINRLQALNKGSLVAPYLKNISVGSVGRLGNGSAWQVSGDKSGDHWPVTVHTRDAEYVQIGSRGEWLPDETTAVLLQTDEQPHKSQTVRFTIQYFKPPAAVEVVGFDGQTPIVRPFDLDAWAKDAKRKRP